jgi:hypothetical protein
MWTFGALVFVGAAVGRFTEQRGPDGLVPTLVFPGPGRSGGGRVALNWLVVTGNDG